MDLSYVYVIFEKEKFFYNERIIFWKIYIIFYKNFFFEKMVFGDPLSPICIHRVGILNTGFKEDWVYPWTKDLKKKNPNINVWEVCKQKT